ncbi:MAG: short-chain dehydrogenase [Burkholderiales bacterium RIFCSPHIGHO2_01_FULL_64_960]|nr:MAG: short-chain dehydrogenase [Burkholderiales bacterium RIFCSPHIGHO2_01_FULL_64_960]
MLTNQVALVTGAGSGIGRAIAQSLAREGARVVVTDVADAACQETVDVIQAAGGVASYCLLDVSRPDEHRAAVEFAVRTYGGLHLACNNAGISRGRSGTYHVLTEVPDEDWFDVLNVNLSGVFFGMRAQIPAILAAGGGGIVNVASVMGQVAGPKLAAYVASKHGVVGLTKAAAVEFASQGVRINAVGPGYIRTPMLTQKDDTTLKTLVDRHPVGRLGEPEEIAETVAWLCSRRAGFTTGSFFPVDGGYLAV